MKRALTETRLGYYASSEMRPTRSGDYLTAPELHPFFGRCIGRFLAALWEDAGSPGRFLVREYGAGRGTLRRSTVDGLRLDDSGPAEAIEWQTVDLPHRSDGTEEPAHAILANEYLDALPVHRVIQDGGLREIFVAWRDGWFTEVLDEPSSPELAAYLLADDVVLSEGQRGEICLAASDWLAQTARTLHDDGRLLVIDYGHDAAELFGPRRMAGTLLTYRGHEVGDDPFAAVGHTDITSHVDVSALERAADSAGLEQVGSTDQARFLASLGLGELLADLGRAASTDPGDYLEARSAVARLLDPRHLGGFRVLAWGRRGPASASAALPGFGAAP